MEDDGPWFVSQEFHNAGRWMVHLGGANRPKKVFFNHRAEADRCARILNELAKHDALDASQLVQ